MKNKRIKHLVMFSVLILVCGICLIFMANMGKHTITKELQEEIKTVESDSIGKKEVVETIREPDVIIQETVIERTVAEQYIMEFLTDRFSYTVETFNENLSRMEPHLCGPLYNELAENIAGIDYEACHLDSARLFICSEPIEDNTYEAIVKISTTYDADIWSVEDFRENYILVIKIEDGSYQILQFNRE